jgi:hypothetical protein
MISFSITSFLFLSFFLCHHKLTWGETKKEKVDLWVCQRDKSSWVFCVEKGVSLSLSQSHSFTLSSLRHLKKERVFVLWQSTRNKAKRTTKNGQREQKLAHSQKREKRVSQRKQRQQS